MSELVLSSVGERLKAMTVEELFKSAERFGNVRIYSSKRPAPNCYKCTIEFNSIHGTTLEASSEHFRPLQVALIEAIDRAERIVSAYK